MHRRWRSRLRLRHKQRTFLAITAAVTLCLFASGCHNRTDTTAAAASPESLYRQIDRQFEKGDLSAAQHTAEQAVQRFSTTDPLWAARFRVALARVYLFEGNNAGVIATVGRPLPAGLEDEPIIRQHLLLAVAQKRLGHPLLSRESMAKAEAMHPQGQLWAEMRSFEGVLLFAQGNYNAAEPLLQEALAEAHRTGARSLEMRMWGNLGFVALQLNHFDDALDRFTRASVIAQTLGDRVTLEKCLGNIGWVYFSTGDFPRALLNAQAAATEAKAVGASIDQVQWVRNAGMSQYQTNNLVEARSTFVRALNLAEGLHDDDLIYQTHIALAYLLLKLRSPEAEFHVHEALRLGAFRTDHDTVPNLLEAILLIQQNQEQAAQKELLKLATAKEADSSPPIQWEAENTLATLYSNAGRRRQDADHWFTTAIATFHRERLSLKAVELQLPFLENGSSLYIGYMEHLIRTHRTVEALNILDQSRAETLAEGLGSSAIQAGRILSAQALSARLHATILVYSLGQRASYLWAINSTGERFFSLSGSDDILRLVARHTQAILASKDLLAQQDATGRRLYDALIQPAASMISPGSRVFLIADKGLGALNFETLIPPPAPNTQPHYWIEDVALTNARSLRLLAATQPHAVRPTTQRMLLFGDPIYRSGDYPPLPNAAAEISSVAAHFPIDRRSVIAGEQASPAAYATSNPGSFAYLHFVAHATANETNPLDSAIILSTPSGGLTPAPYKLYARDILGRPLHAELVTLSSCYGSGTRNYSGEGVVGLVWAFLRAGAHSVIGSMWEVSDVSTPQLMDTLYTGLLHGEQPDQALRSAKLQMLHSAGIFRKPLYWASFQLYAGH